MFHFWNKPNINEGIRTFQQTPGAVLLDVRTTQEYKDGHIPGSQNLPLHRLNDVEDQIPSQDTPIYIYCHSGARSRQAATFLMEMGYPFAYNIGGVAEYDGRLEA